VASISGDGENIEGQMPKVLRTKTILGTSIPAIIHNGQYFFTDIDVYEDGLISCWHTVDLDLFRQELERGWIVTSIPEHQELSVHGLGNWVVSRGTWLHTKKSFHDHVETIVKSMNPEMRNLYQHFEKKVNGIIHETSARGAIFREDKRFERDLFPTVTIGDSINLFRKTEVSYQLARLSVFPDGSIEVSRLSEAIRLDLDKLEDLVKEGVFLSDIPQNARVEIRGVGSFTATSSDYAVSVENKLLELRDMIRKLNGDQTAVESCRLAYGAYLKNPSVELKERLRAAYENIPDHHRKYVGDMDTKDIPVRMIIYGEEEIENWSHRIASREAGIELPTISVPKPTDE
jgi:hypothetical protein